MYLGEKCIHVIREFSDQRLLQLPLAEILEKLFSSPSTYSMIEAFSRTQPFAPQRTNELNNTTNIAALTALRQMRSCLNLKLGNFVGLFAEWVRHIVPAEGALWTRFAERVNWSNFANIRVLKIASECSAGSIYSELVSGLEQSHPHAIYPTSTYRESFGNVVTTADGTTIDAVTGVSACTTIRISEHVLSAENELLADIYRPLKRCVALIDQNVDKLYGASLDAYFEQHGIQSERMVYRAMEVDKDIRTVERMIADFKRLGVSRNEPVLIVGGGVLADTGGLACALYHRNTPYVILSTSVVTGIDAGPSPRTCCDGFGYKNLFGAYHAPIIAITDRSFFATLHPGWLRHGLAKIIKMATVKNAELFELLDQAGTDLLRTRFGTVGCGSDSPIHSLSNRILGSAVKSYVEAEYGNLYETHQCRPHAYGHTWSPGFEIEAGLLHGHAVGIGMGFGAFVSYLHQWIQADDLHRILRLISSFELSLWDDVLLNGDTLWSAQTKIVQKRGGNLVAPLPKHRIGYCGYLNHLERTHLNDAIIEYQRICADYPRHGRGVEPYCHDVGLEDPATTAPKGAQSTALSTL